MPIIATPISAPTSSDISSAGTLITAAPEENKLHGETLWRKRRAVAIHQTASRLLRIDMRGEIGLPINLADYGFSDGEPGSSSSSSSSSSSAGGYSLAARFREATFLSTVRDSAAVTVVDAEAGVVSAPIPTSVSSTPGVYVCEIGLLDESESLIYVDSVYLWNNHSSWSDDNCVSALPHVDEVRMSLRESDPLESVLRDEFQYALGEICYAAVRVIHRWEELPPPIKPTYLTTTFPFKSIWLTGIRLFLMEAVLEHYRRNKLPYTAAGVSSDDYAKDGEYGNAWREALQQFEDAIKRQKLSLNVQRTFGIHGSGYSYYSRYTY